MATYALIHGAGADSWYWHQVAPRLEALGHDVVAPDLPSHDDSAQFNDYAGVVIDAIGDRGDLVVVGQSLGAFTAPLVCAQVPTNLMVLVAAMVPAPGESALEWFTNTGWEHARAAQLTADGRADDGYDVVADLFHDVPADIVAAAMARGERAQSGTPMTTPWPLDTWPDTPTRFVLCTQDRFLPAHYLRPIVQQRLGITPDEIDAGHLPALSQPDELVSRLENYRLASSRAATRVDRGW